MSRADDFSVWSDEAGADDAPLVALIHGTMDRSSGMLKLSRRLDERFRVLRYDRRGYGRSVPAVGEHAGPFGMSEQVSDLVTILGGRRAVLIGHSYGGNVALAAAMLHPGLVAGVAVYETPMSWEPWWPTTTAGAAARTSAGSPAEAAEQFMRRLVGDATWEALPVRTRDTRRGEGAAMVGELNDLRANRPWRPDQIHCPVVLGVGSLANEHHRVGMRHLQRVLPGAQLHELEGCRHDAPTSHSQQFADTIVDAIAFAAGDQWATAVNRSTVTGS